MDTTNENTTQPSTYYTGAYLAPSQLLPEEGEAAERDLMKVIGKRQLNATKVNDLRTRLARSARGENAITLMEFDFPGPPEFAGPQKIVTTRRGVLPVEKAVDLLLDDERNPEAEIERQKIAVKAAAIENDRDMAKRVVDEQLERERHARVAARLRRWNMRPPMERSLLRLAHARPQDADLIRAIALALTNASNEDDTLPPDDIDLQLPQRRA